MSKNPAVLGSELLARTAGGDRLAFRELYAQAGPRLFAICLRMMKSRDQAEDVLQESFIKIWERSHLYDPAKGEAMAWMATVTRHCALDRLRRHPVGTVAFDEAVVAEVENRMAELQGNAGDSGDLHRCLKHLREDYRNAVVLAYVNGMTHEDLSRQLGKPMGTIKSWVRRGLEQLKECMAQ
jgi:RNA polymerase sigma-70 factor (ECF subfamily)